MVMVSLFGRGRRRDERERAPVGRVLVGVDKSRAPPKRILLRCARRRLTHRLVIARRSTPIVERQAHQAQGAQTVVVRPMTTCTNSSGGVSPALTSAWICSSVPVRCSSGSAATQLIEPM